MLDLDQFAATSFDLDCANEAVELRASLCEARDRGFHCYGLMTVILNGPPLPAAMAYPVGLTDPRELTSV